MTPKIRCEADFPNQNVPPLKLLALVSDFTLKTPADRPASETCSRGPPAPPARAPNPDEGSEPRLGLDPGATPGRPSRGDAILQKEGKKPSPGVEVAEVDLRLQPKFVKKNEKVQRRNAHVYEILG